MSSAICSLALLYLLAATSFHTAAADELAAAFSEPPAATRPRCYWYWMDGNVSKEGITRDLEAMKRVGIGEGDIGIIGGESGSPPKTDVKGLTEPWWAMIEHAIREGGRLGVDIGLFNSPGWSQSGGPWVKPNQAMRYLTLPEIRVHGPQHFEGKLGKTEGGFQDVAVVAFPAPAGDGTFATISSRSAKEIAFAMPTPFTARSLTIYLVKPTMVEVNLQFSEDGTTYRTLKRVGIDRRNMSVQVGPVPLAPITVAFPATTARFFRLSLSHDDQLGDVQLSSAARVEHYMDKQLAKVSEGSTPAFDFYTWAPQPEPESPGLVVAPRSVFNLTKKMRPDGTLKWDVPAGDWIIVRAGMLPTGTKNGPATPELTGPEVDKMNREALKEHFEAYVGKLLKRMPVADRKAWKNVIADSYEMGPQNWTDEFAAAFQKRFGYDPLRFLPVMTGRIVGSADMSDRFLWDLRRLIADRVAHDYVGGLRDLCHAHGLKMWLENYGHWGFPAEFLQYGGASDEIGGEFWAGSTDRGVEVRAAASACHIYGKPRVWAEAFTGGPSFLNTPRDLKARGDWAFCQGINQFVLHVYIHQPRDDQKPGINAWFGTEFNRHNTWFEQSKSWIDYLRRCSVLLQAGNPVADIAYFIGEDTPKMDGSLKPGLPPGYDYDFINAEVIEQRLEVKDGRFVLPDGTSYKLLVLPESATMRPAVLKKISNLVAAGGRVYGQAPERSPSLENFPSCDTEVKSLADALWKQGRVLTGGDLGQTLQKLSTPADIIAPKDILWKHRRDGVRDIYFLSNQKNQFLSETLSFRVGNRPPSLWWPDTGRIEPVPFKVVDGRTTVSIPFQPLGSVFVVFGGSPASDIPAPKAKSEEIQISRAIFEAIDGAGSGDVTAALTGIIKAGGLPLRVTPAALGGDPAFNHVKRLRVEYSINGKPGSVDVPEDGILQLQPGQEIAGPWSVEFPGQNVAFEKLISWTNHTDPAIKYYSGKATYQTTFLAGEVKVPTFLDLGTVEALATVTVNGQSFPTLWKYPYRADISSALKPGRNELSITVVNTWNNRMVGDAALPQDQRQIFVTNMPKNKNSPLQPSGLIGPVQLLSH